MVVAAGMVRVAVPSASVLELAPCELDADGCWDRRPGSRRGCCAKGARLLPGRSVGFPTGTAVCCNCGTTAWDVLAELGLQFLPLGIGDLPRVLSGTNAAELSEHPGRDIKSFINELADLGYKAWHGEALAEGLYCKKAVEDSEHPGRDNQFLFNELVDPGFKFHPLGHRPLQTENVGPGRMIKGNAGLIENVQQERIQDINIISLAVAKIIEELQ